MLRYCLCVCVCLCIRWLHSFLDSPSGTQYFLLWSCRVCFWFRFAMKLHTMCCVFCSSFFFLVAAALQLITFLYCNSSDLDPSGHLRNRQCVGHGVRLGVIENDNVEHASNWLWHMHVITTIVKQTQKRIKLLKSDSIEAHLNSLDIYTAYKASPIHSAQRFVDNSKEHTFNKNPMLFLFSLGNNLQFNWNLCALSTSTFSCII